MADGVLVNVGSGVLVYVGTDVCVAVAEGDGVGVGITVGSGTTFTSGSDVCVAATVGTNVAVGTGVGAPSLQAATTINAAQPAANIANPRIERPVIRDIHPSYLTDAHLPISKCGSI